MKTISGKRMCKFLEQKAWQLARAAGSHHVYVILGQSVRISVPVQGNSDLKLGLQRAIMKLADISQEDLRRMPVFRIRSAAESRGITSSLPCYHGTHWS
jgi:predicted RNA binding protein YcfA (HicA-like mRNA interferase family)